MPSFVDLLVKTRKWFLRNEDSGETLEGQFAPTNVTRDVVSNYAQHTALNRGKTILQYLNGKADTLVIQANFFALDVTKTGEVERRLEKLINWAQRDPDLRRPPIVTFWMGDGHLEQRSVIDSLTGITYGEPTITGAIREVTFTMNLLAQEDFDIDDVEIFETRYHRSKRRDYYEWLTQREYGLPLFGDAIRKRNPSKPNLQPGNVIALPTIEAIRTERIEPKSIALVTAYGRQTTPQRELRIDIFKRRSASATSHIIGSSAFVSAPTVTAPPPGAKIMLDAYGVETTSSELTRWIDKSGNGYHFEPVTNRPLVDPTGHGDKPAVSFRGLAQNEVVQSLVPISMKASKAITIIMEISYADQQQFQVLWEMSDDAVADLGTGAAFILYAPTGGASAVPEARLQTYDGLVAGVETGRESGPNEHPPDNVWFNMIATHDMDLSGDEARLYFDNVEVGQVWTPGDILAFFGDHKWQIGGRLAAFPLTAKISEFLAYDFILSDEQRKQATDYLKARWRK